MLKEIVLAKSKAGHDKMKCYVILQELEDYVLLANGTTKTVSNPKKKKKIHIWRIERLPNEVKEYANQMEELDDLCIRRLLNAYKNAQNK